MILITVDLVHSWRRIITRRMKKKQTLYQTKRSLFLLSATWGGGKGGRGCRLVPRDVRRRRSTCAHTFLRTRVTHVSQEERSESMRQKPRIPLARSLRARTYLPRENVPFVAATLRHYNRITKICYDLPQIRRVCFLSVSNQIEFGSVGRISCSVFRI